MFQKRLVLKITCIKTVQTGEKWRKVITPKCVAFVPNEKTSMIIEK
jgi:hypothetical protein